MIDWAEYYGHVPGKIDPLRGPTKRTVVGGGKVSMYKEWPGLFLDNMGNPVPDELARRVGFDVDGLRKKAVVEKRIAEATAKIRKEFEVAEAQIRAEVEAEDEPNPFGVPITETEVADPDRATDFNAKGEPRGTEHYMMDYIGGGFWNVIERETKNIIGAKIKGKAAIDGMLEAQRNRIDVSTAVAS